MMTGDVSIVILLIDLSILLVNGAKRQINARF
jgi:hypothetical protein